MIYEIKSKYILKHILNYIEDKNFQLKLFFHSKYFKNKLEINLLSCYKKYLDELGFDFKRYLYKEEDEYEKDILIKQFNNFILKYNLDEEKFKKILYEVIKNQNDKDEEKYINIDSPLFEIISKIEYFGKLYTIYISQKNIDKYKLKDEYIQWSINEEIKILIKNSYYNYL